MHLLSYYCVQVLVLLVSQLEFSYSVPIRPPSHFDLLIDPLHQSELEDLESKKIVPKSVLNVPYITPPQASPRCPAGQTRLSGGPCVQRVVSSGLSDDQSLVAELTKQYFKRKQPPKRHRHPSTRTTTQEPVPTTETVTESPVSLRDLATTTVWSTTNPTYTSTQRSQEQALAEEIMTSTPTTVADKDVTTESAAVEETSLLIDLPTGTFSLAQDPVPQTTETYSINDRTTLSYGMDATEFPSKMSDADESTLTTTELPMEMPKETTQYEETYERRTELPKGRDESNEELTEIPTAVRRREEIEGEITEPSVTAPNVLASLNNSSDADGILSENSNNPTEKVTPVVETSSPFAAEISPQESQTMQEEITTPVVISVEDASNSRTIPAPAVAAVGNVEEFTTAIYLSQPAQMTPLTDQTELPESDMIFDFIPSPSDIYKPTMPPRYTHTPKISLPLEFSSSASRSGRLDEDSPTRRSSFISYDYFMGPQGLPRSDNFNPAYAFS